MAGSQRYDIAVIGGGIIGLATAMRFSQEFPRRKTIVLEKEPAVAQHQTGHNSGVIHAGIYYTPGSQKANFCAAGGAMLRRFADERGIPYEDCGKVIVAANEAERTRLEEVYRRGLANGVKGLEVIDGDRLRELEPHAAGVGAVLSPGTGIIDYSRVAEAYAEVIIESGGELMTGAEVRSITRSGGTLHLETERGDLSAAAVVNCAGLHADRVARLMGVDTGVRIIPFRGEYLSLRPERAHLVRGLIYPVPDPRVVFLGVHFTKRIDGSVEAGPKRRARLRPGGIPEDELQPARDARRPGLPRLLADVTDLLEGGPVRRVPLDRKGGVRALPTAARSRDQE